ncbi:Signal transduction histidine-protein kinase AtoS [bioreactor metagenome]|uniref:Signal transduction histidine-protein kinase AtoS n=1 Tax=bioreactor metagenome TaxID=1076179 RepID=A0A645DLM7_9ZZZZ
MHADKLVLLGQLSAGIAHDIRNPLAAVNLNLQLLKRGIAPELPEHNFIELALQGVERIHKIVEVSLNFSKPTVIEVSKLNINSLIPTVLDLTASAIKSKNITVNLELDEKLLEISADAKQLQQVFVNLITNGADAIKDTGMLTIKTYNEKPTKQGEKGFAVVAISDDGCGITEEDLSKIFNPFFTRKPEGTGLGLPITHRILHQHGGVIDVESKLGLGTTFYVKLPIFIDFTQ